MIIIAELINEIAIFFAHTTNNIAAFFASNVDFVVYNVAVLTIVGLAFLARYAAKQRLTRKG